MTKVVSFIPKQCWPWGGGGSAAGPLHPPPTLSLGHLGAQNLIVNDSDSKPCDLTTIQILTTKSNSD